MNYFKNVSFSLAHFWRITSNSHQEDPCANPVPAYALIGHLRTSVLPNNVNYLKLVRDKKP